MLTPKERAFLRSRANDMPDLVMIGKDGIDDQLIHALSNNLTAHEIVKIKVQKSSEFEPKELANELAKTTESEVIGVVGSKIILYRYSTKKGFKHFLEQM